jgi:hypothetical protein
VSGDLAAEEHYGAVVTAVVWMIVALLLLGIDAVGERRVECRRDAVRLTDEASAAYEDQRVSG